jgi:hypothetical protein
MCPHTNMSRKFPAVPLNVSKAKQAPSHDRVLVLTGKNAPKYANKRRKGRSRATQPEMKMVNMWAEC